MATRCVQKTRRDCHRSATSTSTCWDATRSPYLNRSLGASSGRSETPLTAVANRTFRSIAPQTPDPGQAGGQDADREAAQGRGRSVDAVTPHAFITKVAGLSCSIEHGRYPWIPPEIGRPDGRNHTGEGSGVSRGRGRSTSKLAGDQGGGEMTRSTARRGARARLGSVWPLC